MYIRRLGSYALLSAVAVAPIVAACGGADHGAGPHVPTPPASGGPSSAAAATAPDGGAAPTGPSTTKPEGPAGSGAGPMKPITASAMETQIKELGLDMKALPALGKIERPKLMKVMQSFSKALGTKCEGCHEPNDFRAWTPKKKVAAKMWDEFVRKLALEDGSPLYCDSCHNGRMEFLDHHDKKELGKWMDTNFVSKLRRVDKQDHGCDTCHGDPFEGEFLKAWAAAPASPKK
jgi:hypothetical protein